MSTIYAQDISESGNQTKILHDASEEYIVTAGLGVNSHFIIAKIDPDSITQISVSDNYVTGEYTPRMFAFWQNLFIQVVEKSSTKRWMLGKLNGRNNYETRMKTRDLPNSLAVSQTSNISSNDFNTPIYLYYVFQDEHTGGNILFKEEVNARFETQNNQRTSIGVNCASVMSISSHLLVVSCTIYDDRYEQNLLSIFSIEDLSLIHKMNANDDELNFGSKIMIVSYDYYHQIFYNAQIPGSSSQGRIGMIEIFQNKHDSTDIALYASDEMFSNNSYVSYGKYFAFDRFDNNIIISHSGLLNESTDDLNENGTSPAPNNDTNEGSNLRSLETNQNSSSNNSDPSWDSLCNDTILEESESTDSVNNDTSSNNNETSRDFTNFQTDPDPINEEDLDDLNSTVNQWTNESEIFTVDVVKLCMNNQIFDEISNDCLPIDLENFISLDFQNSEAKNCEFIDDTQERSRYLANTFCDYNWSVYEFGKFWESWSEYMQRVGFEHSEEFAWDDNDEYTCKLYNEITGDKYWNDILYCPECMLASSCDYQGTACFASSMEPEFESPDLLYNYCRQTGMTDHDFSIWGNSVIDLRDYDRSYGFKPLVITPKNTLWKWDIVNNRKFSDLITVYSDTSVDITVEKTTNNVTTTLIPLVQGLTGSETEK